MEEVVPFIFFFAPVFCLFFFLFFFDEPAATSSSEEWEEAEASLSADADSLLSPTEPPAVLFCLSLARLLLCFLELVLLPC